MCDAHVLHVTANQNSWHTGSVMFSLSARLITQDFATAVSQGQHCCKLSDNTNNAHSIFWVVANSSPTLLQSK